MPQVALSDVNLYVLERGAGTPLLLVHGFPLDHQMWQGQVDDLAEDFRVIAPDLRGFGQSGVTPGTVTMERLADDLAELLDQLHVQSPVVFCGLSMGGYVGWQFWRRHADRLSRLILCDTRAAADSAEAAEQRHATAKRVIDEGLEFLVADMTAKLFSDQTHRQRRQLIESTRRVMQATHPEGCAAALRGMSQRPDATAWLAQIELPSLLVCGQEDAISSVREMQAVADAMPNCELAVIPGAGHMAPLEDPVHVNKVIRGFLL